MRKTLYILIFGLLSLNAQSDSIYLKNVIKDKSFTLKKKDSITKNEIVINKKKDKIKEIITTANKNGFWEISIAIMVGLLPIMLQIWYSLKQYKKSQIDKYGSFLYEKQFPVYIQIFKKTNNLYDIAQSVFISLKNNWLPDVYKKFEITPPEIKFLNELSDLRDFIKENSLILPNDFLTKVIEFILLNNIIRNTINRNIVGDKNVLNKNLNNIDEVGGLKEFSKTYNEKFYNLNLYMKNLIGAEYFTMQSLKYTAKKKTNFIYLKDREAKIE